MTIFSAYNYTKKALQGAGIESFVFEAKQIIRYVTGYSNRQIMDKYQEPLDDIKESILLSIVKQRCTRYPLQYIIGEWSFFGYDFAVGEGVLCPRPDTEVLVETAMELEKAEEAQVADLCAGTGCVGITLALKNKGWKVLCAEKYEKAFSYLEKNITKNGADNVTAVLLDIANPIEDKKFDLELVEKRACIQDALSNDEVLPADIKIFITTSKNKEGININDPDIKDMIVESHQRDEVRQMAGRVREGLNHLVIVSDAAQHFSNGSPLFAKIDRKCVRSINAAAQEYWTHKDGRLSVKEKEKNISKIEERYRYVRYDCFREEFRFYTGRFKGDALADLSERSFKQAMESCKDASYTGDYSGYDDLAAWFPDARTAIDPQSTLKEAVSKLLVDREILGKEISKEERDELAEGIRYLIRSCEQTDTNIKANFVSLAPVLKKLGYKQNETPGKRKGSSFVITEE